MRNKYIPIIYKTAGVEIVSMELGVYAKSTVARGESGSAAVASWLFVNDSLSTSSFTAATATTPTSSSAARRRSMREVLHDARKRGNAQTPNAASRRPHRAGRRQRRHLLKGGGGAAGAAGGAGVVGAAGAAGTSRGSYYSSRSRTTVRVNQMSSR